MSTDSLSIDSKRTVFITGATGVMGFAALKELSRRLDRFNLRLLVRDSDKNRKKLSSFIGVKGIEILWGDILNKDDIVKGIEGSDIVIHLAGMVSPAADYFPEKTFRVNTDGMRNIVEAVKQAENRDNIAVVYVGSVAQYGPCNPPDHWRKCGDILTPAKMDAYARSKIAAERILTDSGLRKWVCLRQTAILSEALLNKAFDPITFHVPLKGVLEWVTAEDSGRLIANLCEEWVPDSFWCRFYNIGGGKGFRVTNYEFEKEFLKALHCASPEKIFDARWFATDNFHGAWFSDSDLLENILHFRSGQSFEEYLKNLSSSLPWYYSLTPLAPAFLIKCLMKYVASKNELAPLYWKKNNMEDRLNAHFGGLEKWKSMPDWNGMDLSRPDDTPPVNQHNRIDCDKKRTKYGISENQVAIENLCIEDMRRKASEFEGRCISEDMISGDIFSLLEWETSDGIRFKASPASVFLGGHWGLPIQE